MAMIGKVLRMHHRENKSVREIARATSLSRNTVRKYLRVPVAQPPKYVRRAASTKLTPFIEMVEMALLADARRPRKERRTARALLQQIAAAGYEGGYTQLTDFIRAWRAQQGSVAVGKAFVPLAFELGEAFQFDWSDEALVIGGIYRKLQVAHMKLCASRAFWLVAYPSQGHEMLFDAHTRSFAALGGVARRGIYDNMKTAVDKVHKGKGRTVNARFSVMCAHYLYDPDFCNVASGWEKGVVEKNVQDSRRRIWIDARERRFASFDELNAWLGERCRALWQEVRHGAPFTDLPQPLQRLRRALLRETGGDRLMARVLALVPTAGLEAVLVAVELALDGAPPSGRVSVEHVINVLARLNAAPRPANVETALQVLTPPIADTARYDRLRNIQEADHA